MDIELKPAPVKKPRVEDESNLGFGKYFTDNMFVMNYKKRGGLA